MAETPLTKRQRKEAARQARLEREHAAAAAGARKRRLTIIGGALAAAVVVVVVAIAVSSGGGTKTASPGASAGGAVNGRTEMTQLLQGIPQHGNTLGNPNAKVTLNEFADLRCPFCRDFALQTLPLIVRDYVRPGKVKIVYQDLGFLGPESVTAAAAGAAAGQQDKLWNFADLFYFNQGSETTPYVTSAFITRLYSAIPGLDVAKANAARTRSPATSAVNEPRTLADQFQIASTPSFTYGRTGQQPKLLETSTNAYGDFQKALDPLLK
jgi:protein-disulfide isomerase